MAMEMREEDLIRMNKVLRHRLRNSASGLKASMTFLAKELAGRMTPRELEYFPLIQHECDAITAVTNRMQLLFDPVAPSPALPVKEILDRAVQSVRADFPTTLFEQEGAVSAEMMVAEKDTLYIPLCELLRNAAEVVSGGRVLIRVDAAPGEITVTVADSGGAHSEEGEDPFRPFFTTKTRHLGLGLCIARKYAEHGGGAVSLLRDAEKVVSVIHLPVA